MGIETKIVPPDVIVNWEGPLRVADWQKAAEDLKAGGVDNKITLSIIGPPEKRVPPMPATKTCPKCGSNLIWADAKRCRSCHTDIGASSFKQWLNWGFTHPVVLVAIGTLLSIPQVTKWVAKSQAAEEARTRKGLDAIAAEFQVERDLNAVTTLFYSFGRDFGAEKLPLTVYAAAQHDLRESVIQVWTTFDRNAWWWYGQVGLEASLVRALDDRQRHAFDVLTNAYSDILMRTTAQVDRLWTHFLRGPQPRPAETETLRKTTWTCFEALGNKRRALATRIAGFFDHPVSADVKDLKLDEPACPDDHPAPRLSGS